MTNDMREFLFLNVQYRDSHWRRGPVADYIRSEDFRNEAQRIGADPLQLARLTLVALRHFALDPLAGTTLGNFINLQGDETGNIWFNLRFNRMVNFIGTFALPRDSEDARQLLQAIQDNLDSKLFKAASMHRRLDQRRVRRQEQLSKRAKAAYDGALELALKGYDRTASQEVQHQQWTVARRRADDAFDAVYDPAHKRLHARVRAVASAAFGSEFRGNFIDILTVFVTRYIYPEPRSILTTDGGQVA